LSARFCISQSVVCVSAFFFILVNVEEN